MDLYSLPKDMLVKMISTIQEETEKKYKSHMELLQKIYPHLEKCVILTIILICIM